MNQLTNNVAIQLPKYQSHKEVWALKIVSAEKIGETTITLSFAEEAYAPATLDGDAAQRFMKCADEGVEDLGYYVVYKDGYISWSPTKAFEEGYTLID